MLEFNFMSITLSAGPPQQRTKTPKTLKVRSKLTVHFISVNSFSANLDCLQTFLKRKFVFLKRISELYSHESMDQIQCHHLERHRKVHNEALNEEAPPDLSPLSFTFYACNSTTLIYPAQTRKVDSRFMYLLNKC